MICTGSAVDEGWVFRAVRVAAIAGRGKNGGDLAGGWSAARTKRYFEAGFVRDTWEETIMPLPLLYTALSATLLSADPPRAGTRRGR